MDADQLKTLHDFGSNDYNILFIFTGKNMSSI